MAVFQFNNILLPYQIQLAPFAQDLILLQGSRFNTDYWLPVLEEWKGQPPAGGRIVTCEWQAGELKGKALTDHIQRFILTLGLHSIHVVACDDAAGMIGDFQNDFPGLIEKSLLFPRNAPRGEDLKKAIAEFCASY